MNAQQLKNSILQLAVQGKLVPQDPNDEPASKLVERIRVEKEKLIKEKKVKPDKNPSYIFKGSDNLPYEKVGNEVRCIAEEVPFEIPDSWEWVRLGSILNVKGGKRLPKEHNLTDIPTNHIYIRVTDMKNHTISSDKLKYITENTFQLIKNYIINKDDLYLTIAGTIGNVGIVPDKFDGMNLTENAVKLTDIKINKYYLLHIICSNYIQNQFVDKTNKVAQPKLAIERILTTLFPLPSLAEQQRIVNKLKELEPYIKEYDVAYEKIEKLNNNFPEQLKKSILQDAVQGKLVPQNPKDEPASVLIERIREEKQKLIQEKKIKKDKNESYIFRRDNSHYEKIGNEERCIDDEIPFDIPDSWEWVRLNSIVELITKGSSPKWQGINYVENNGILFLTSENVGSFSLLLNKKKFVETKFNDLSPRSILKKNDFLMNIVGASIGRTALFNIEETNANINQATCIIRIIEKYKSVELLNYLLIFFNSSICYSYMCNNLVDCARANLSMSNIANFLIPLPPLAEQQRIVEKIEQLLPEIKILQK